MTDGSKKLSILVCVIMPLFGFHSKLVVRALNLLTPSGLDLGVNPGISLSITSQCLHPNIPTVLLCTVQFYSWSREIYANVLLK